MHYIFKSKHYSQLDQWVSKEALHLDFGNAGVKALDKMRSTRQFSNNLGDLFLSSSGASFPEKVGEVFEETVGVPGYFYDLNDSLAWIMVYEKDYFMVEGFNEYFITDKLEEAEAWLFQNYYLEGQNVDFSIDTNTLGWDVVTSGDGQLLWSSKKYHY